MINRRRSGARGTPAKVIATAGLATGERVNSASVSDGSHESVRFRTSSHRPPTPGEIAPHIAPLGWEHISLTGDYSWNVDDRPDPDALRPLRTVSSMLAA